MHFYWQAMGVFTGATRYSRQPDGPGEAKGTGGTPSVGAAMAAFNKAAVNKAAVCALRTPPSHCPFLGGKLQAHYPAHRPARRGHPNS